MRKLILLLGCLPFFTISQNIDHWETVIFDNDVWKYLEGTSEPDTNWRKLNFNDTTWLSGQGGIGYGDGAIIYHGITIGECALVGAGSFANKDIPPYSLYAGVPARMIKEIRL